MKRREQLYENYEDALFAILMDKVAEEEGARLREENKRLQDDPEAEVPERVDEAARRTIRRAFGKQRRRGATRFAGKLVNAAAVLVLVLSALFVTAYAAFPEVQLKTLNLLIQSSDVASRLALVGEERVERDRSGSDSLTICGYRIPMLDDFVLLSQEEDKHGGWVKYENDAGATIRIAFFKAGTKYLDTEDVDYYEDISIHGYSGIVVKKNSLTSIVWTEQDHGYSIMLDADNLEVDYTLSIAHEIRFIDNNQ